MRHVPLEPVVCDQEPDEYPTVDLDHQPITSEDEHSDHGHHQIAQQHLHHTTATPTPTPTSTVTGVIGTPRLNLCVVDRASTTNHLTGHSTTNSGVWPLKPCTTTNAPNFVVSHTGVDSSDSLSPTSDEEPLSSYSSADLSELGGPYFDHCMPSRAKKDKSKRKLRSRPTRPLASSSAYPSADDTDSAKLNRARNPLGASNICRPWPHSGASLLRHSTLQYDSENEAADDESTSDQRPRDLPPHRSQLNRARGIRMNQDRGVAAETLCARLVECRSLEDSVKFVEKYRQVIENLTRIVTHEAPAYRNYDFSHLQIDLSAKESFNQNFWHDRSPVVTPADGNCQYHAISLSLTGTEEFTPNVRLAAAVAVIDNRNWFNETLTLVDRGSVHSLIRTIARNYSWGDEMTLVAVSIAIRKQIYLYTCNFGKQDFETVKQLSLEELQDAFRDQRYPGGTGIHVYAKPIANDVPVDDYIMLLLMNEHFIAILPHNQHPTPFRPYNPIVPTFN